MVVVYRNLLTLLKQVRRSREIFQLFRKNQNRSGDRHYLLFLTSQKLIIASRQGYFSDLDRLTQSVSGLSRDNYTPALPINSPPEAYKEKGRRREEEVKRRNTHRERLKNREIRLNRDLFSFFQEFRELLL